MTLPLNKKVAYFSMEVGLSSKIPTYSGGLGVLAGDTLKTASNINFPMIGITLLAKNGYFYQRLENGIQKEEAVKWKVDDFLIHLDTTVNVKISGENVKVGCWLYNIKDSNNFEIPLLFLHTDYEENSPKMRDITDSLYGNGAEYRIMQEIVLGIGGIRMLRALGYLSLDKYHMNEGHSAFLVLELLRELKDKEKVRNLCVFTTHTPVPEGHDKFDMSLVQEIVDPEIFKLMPTQYIATNLLNMTELALDFSEYVNGVAKKHTEVSNDMFPNRQIKSITNGIHSKTWVSHFFENLYEKYIPEWHHNPELLNQVEKIPDEQIWDAHYKSKKQIIDYANATTNAGLDYDYFTIGWARRFTSYKRPEFILSNPERLFEIAKNKGPIQIIFAGKAHPQDENGKQLINKIVEISKWSNNDVNLVYLSNYDMYLAKFFVSGVDLWLNTPAPPKEASGTSGMKCALNGIPSASVLDGWWIEGYAKDKTGWSFETEDELYKLLENEIVDTYYNNKVRWLSFMKNAISMNASFFNTHRMLKEYIKFAYKEELEDS